MTPGARILSSALVAILALAAEAVQGTREDWADAVRQAEQVLRERW